jgi:hypothetical protein
MQFALIGLPTAIIALKRPYLTLDLWVRRSAHEICLSPAMWADDRLNVGLLSRGRFFPRFNQFGHASIANRIFIAVSPRSHATDCRLPGKAGATAFSRPRLFTPVFTPARFPGPFRARNFQQTAAPQTQLQFAAEPCPLYPRKQTLMAGLGMSAKCQKRTSPRQNLMSALSPKKDFK